MLLGLRVALPHTRPDPGPRSSFNLCSQHAKVPRNLRELRVCYLVIISKPRGSLSRFSRVINRCLLSKTPVYVRLFDLNLQRRKKSEGQGHVSVQPGVGLSGWDSEFRALPERVGIVESHRHHALVQVTTQKLSVFGQAWMEDNSFLICAPGICHFPIAATSKDAVNKMSTIPATPRQHSGALKLTSVPYPLCSWAVLVEH